MLTERVIYQEMRLRGARLYRREQQCGGYIWELEGAKIIPASLSKVCTQMLASGELTPVPGQREEYELWAVS